LNFAGKPESTASGLFSASHIGAVELPHHGHADAITVADPYLLFSGDYRRSGPDLILSKDGRDHVVENYFVGEKRAALAAPDGAQLSGDIVSALTGHVQYAQAAGAADTGKVIGHVTKLAGNATVIRNGVSIVLNMGDNVHKGDVVQSGSNSTLGITFIDGTVFGLASNARMVLNEMVYDPNGSSNSSFLTLVQGTITFVAGQTAKHGDMKVDTPVATMGIRGTACLVEVGFDVPVFDPSTSVALSIPVKFQVLQEADGSVGSYFLFAKTDLTYSSPIATINRLGEVTAFSANGQITNYQLTLIAPEVKALIDQTMKLYFPNYNPQVPGSTPANPVTPDTGNKQPINFQIDKPTTVPLDYTFSDPSHPGQTITRTTEVTVTLHNTAPTITVNPVADKPTFQIKDQVVITDPDDPGVNPTSPFNDVPHPYVAGSGKVVSATGPATTPAGLDLTKLINVDPATGTVSYNPESFAFLKGGDKVVVIIAFDANSGPDTVHQTLTLTIDGANDAPTVTSAVTGGGAEGSGLATVNLLNFASDADAGAVLHVENLVWTDTGSGVPAGVTPSADGNSLLVDSNNVAYDHLAQGASFAAHFSYDVVDENGALVHQTATVTIAGTNDAPVTSEAVSETGKEGSGTFNVNLLKNASDVDDGAVLHVANLVRTDASGMPAGFALSPDGNSISVDTESPVYDTLAQGETFTAQFGYDVVDEHGASVHQAATVTISGTNDAPVFTTGPAVTQLSVPADGAPFSRGETFAVGPSMSSDGRFIVFGASNQIPGQDDNSHLGDVYLYDRLTGTYEWISDPANFTNSGITPHAGETYDGLAAISLDGQFVTFRGQFQVTQIIGGQPVTFVQSETFLYNTSTGVTTLVPGLNGDEPSITGSGGLIAATGQSLTAPSGNNFIYNDVLVTDRLGHVVTRISGDANASPVNTADISADGRYVTFWSTASQIEVKNVKPGGGPLDSLTFNVGATWPAGPSTPSGPVAQVYVFDRQTETISLVSVSPTGERGNGNSSVLTLQTSAGFIDIGDDWKSAFSADGRFIIFQSNASNLVAGDSNGATDVFLYDLQTHQVQLVSVAADGSSANGASYRPAISADGHHIVFASDATNLLGASNTPRGATGFQTYIRDFDPATGLLSTGFTGFHNGDNQYGDSISRDGGIVAFGGAALAFSPDQGQAELIPGAAGRVRFSGVSISDFNPAADTLIVTASVAHGTLFSLVAVSFGSGVTIVDGFDGSQGTLKFTGSIDAINRALLGGVGVTYTSTAAGPDAITLTVSDGHGGTATQTTQFDAYAPQITGVSTIGNSIAFDHDRPQAQILAQGQIKFSNDSISDFTPGFNSTSDALTVTVSVGHGTLTPVALGSGVTILGGFDGHAGTLKFTGTIAAVNQALESGAIYAATSGGPDTITVTVADGHGGTATQSTQFNPQAPAIDGELTDGQYEIFVVDRAGGTAGLVIEDSSLTVPNSGTLLTKGAFGFTDADLTDTHTATVIGSPVVDTSHAPGFVAPNGGLGTFTPLAVTESAGSGQVPWTFTVDNALVQSLGTGQYITQTYAVQLDDHHGGHATQNVTVTIAGVNDAPVVTSAGFAVSEGGTTVLGAANIGVSDPDSASFTFTVSNVSHGTFQTTTNGAIWVAATTFTTADLNAGHVRFVHDGGENAPTFSIQADDGTGVNSLSNVLAGSANFTNVDDAPAVTHAGLTISQGHTVTLTTADIDFVDPDSPVVTYTVSNLSHGHFETGVGNDAVETTTFTSADVAAGLVSFVDDGSSGTPAFSLTPNDGSIDGATVDGVVTFSAANYTLSSTEGVIINVTPEGATSGFVFPGAGNVTTPGIPEDRIAIGYDAGASHVVLDNAPLLGVHQMASLSSETHSSGGTTFVSTTLDAGHDVTLVQTLALGDDANFFTTTIDITNNGATDISNLRFLRNFDPDQDVQAHNDYKTFNDVVQNPDGAETFAILSATGVESHTTVAMIGLGAEWRASVFGFTNTDPYASDAFDTPIRPDNLVAKDLSLSLTSSLGTLTANGGHAEVTYITTNNVATSGSNALYGTTGDDTINGLGGDDLLIGLKGADTFVFNAASGGSGHDTIADFTPGQDKISLDYHAFDAAAGPNDFSNWLRTHATDINNNINNNDVLIDLNVDGLHPGVDTILLKNVVSTSLQASDFHTL
jgi:VCBS repeat-containing protein